MQFYDKVSALCLERGISITAMATELGISKGTPSNWKAMDKPPRADTVKKVADFFGVSVDYFKDDNKTTIKSIQDNHGIIGSVHAPVRIINGTERNLSEQEIELLNLYSDLGVVEKAKLLVFASELKNNK